MTADLRQRIADAIGPTMRIGLQDAELDGPGGAQRINEWIEWIATALLPLIAEEREAARAGELIDVADWLCDGGLDDATAPKIETLLRERASVIRARVNASPTCGCGADACEICTPITHLPAD